MSKELYKFEGLKEFLQSEGVQVGDAQGYIPVKSQDVFDKQGQTPIAFISKNGQRGMFATDRNGVEHQVYMYKYRYRLSDHGKPKFHICQCSTIQSFMNRGAFGEYYFANTDEVEVYDMNSGTVQQISQLQLCLNCIKELYQYGKYYDTSKFVAMLKAAGQVPTQTAQETDIFGYVKDWEKISKAYRSIRNFTCEKCGFDGSSPFDRMFMHTHHKDGNKLNNDQSNFQCLCIKCHSEVDATHQNNFSEGDKKKQLENFMKRLKK